MRKLLQPLKQTGARLALAALVMAGFASGGPRAKAQILSDRRVEEAISRGIDYLVTSQAQDGSISNGQYQNIMTAWAVLSMAAAGHTPNDPTREGEAMRLALDFVLRSGVPWGKQGLFFGGRAGPNVEYNALGPEGMVGHGMTTLALTELLAMHIDKLREAELRNCCTGAVNMIVATQNPDNGWHNVPVEAPKGFSTLTTSCWELLALRSAREAGMPVPKRTFELGALYVASCYCYAGTMVPFQQGVIPVQPGAQPGATRDLQSYRAAPVGFRSSPNFVPTAFEVVQYLNQLSGVRALQACGLYQAPELLETGAKLAGTRTSYDNYTDYYACTFFYSQAMPMLGPGPARDGYRALEALLLPHQNADGSWLAGAPTRAGKPVNIPAPHSPGRMDTPMVLNRGTTALGSPGGVNVKQAPTPHPPDGLELGERAVGSIYSTSLGIISLSERFHRLPMSKF